jgi:glutathionyl-hydroquinone reductase
VAKVGYSLRIKRLLLRLNLACKYVGEVMTTILITSKLNTMKTIYQNDLEELSALMNRILGEIETYSHVSEFLPKSLIKEIEKFDSKIISELERRESIIIDGYIENIGHM